MSKVKTESEAPFPPPKTKNKILVLPYPIPTTHNDFNQTFEILKHLDRLKGKIIVLTFEDKMNGSQVDV